MRLVFSLLLNIALLQAYAVDSWQDLQGLQNKMIEQLNVQSKLYTQLLEIAKMHYPTISRIVFEVQKRNELIHIDNQLWYIRKDVP